MKSFTRPAARLIFIAALLFSMNAAFAIDEKYAAQPLSGNQIHKDSSSTVSDTVYFNSTLKPTQTAFTVRNLISFSINELGNFTLPDTFKISVQFKVYFTKDVSGTATQDSSALITLTIDYNKNNHYDHKAIYTFTGGYRAQVKITQVTVITGTLSDFQNALLLENEIDVTREYQFTCSNNAVQTISLDTNTVRTEGELHVSWPQERAADEYDLEWTYVDTSAVANYYKTGSTTIFDPKKVFTNNASRVSIAKEDYMIPMLFDNQGLLFCRVRAVQVKSNGQRMESAWSSDYTNGLGQYTFKGHQDSLNWQSTTSFAEEGKRKSVVQYFDGSLRGRQTVTKDNTTDTTIVAETYYDHQGRPVVQVLPTPSLSSIIKYTPKFNALNGAEYDKDHYDGNLQDSCYCTQGAPAFDSAYGAAKYYSSNNQLVNTGFHKYIPESFGYPFSETRYTPDNTGRVSIQSGVGKDFQIGASDPDNHTHETKYFYSAADQAELDALFGTEVGNASHYFKNMVRDANGQYSISYVDMHGRTIATALAGFSTSKMDTLASNNSMTITKKLLDSNTNIINGTSIVSSKGLVVTKAGNHRFRYSLLPDSISIKDCSNTSVCYDCVYDLEITITDECNNSTLPNHAPIVIDTTNFRLDTTCNANVNFPGIDTTIFLREGNYLVTKKLTIDKKAMDYYRDSVFLRRNTCKSVDQFIQDELTKIKMNLQCHPTCQSCLDSLGSWTDFRAKYMAENGIPNADTPTYRGQALIAYNSMLGQCNQLCNNNGVDVSAQDQMLADVSPSYGQYANPDAIDVFSIFAKDINGNVKYTTVTGWVDQDGNADKVLFPDGTSKTPNQLSIPDFVANFKPSWAQSLLPFHPEYWKLVKSQQIASSNTWDEHFASVDSYKEAVDSGFLNPGNFTTHPSGTIFNYNSAHRDPFFTDLITNGVVLNFKPSMQDSLSNIALDASHNPVNMWSLATIMAHCDTAGNACFDTYKPLNMAFNLDTACSGELDIAWRYFRDMYLQKKREFVELELNAYLFTHKSSTILKDVVNANHTLNFPDPFAYQPATTAAPTTPAQAKDSLNAFIDSSCVNYAVEWWQELKPCNFTSDDSARIIPRLIKICEEGGDSAHPLGSSSVAPTSTYQFRSFEQFIQFYRDSTGKAYNDSCNVYIINAPKPYEPQPVYYDKPIFTKPDSCECHQINTLYQQYQTYGSGDSTFAAYIFRTTGTRIYEGVLDTLRMVCNDTASCRFLKQPLSLPPVLQCGVQNVCVSCGVVSSLYSDFRTTFPAIVPRLDNGDSLQREWNKIFENYMNSHLGFSKLTSEYLVFMDTCKILKPDTTNCNSALQFNGTPKQRITIIKQNTRLELGTGNFTIEAMLKPKRIVGITGRYIIISNRANVSGPLSDGFFISVEDDGNIQFQLQGCYNRITTGVNLFDDKAHHVALRRDGDSLTLFVDGVSVPWVVSCTNGLTTPPSQRDLSSPGKLYISYDSVAASQPGAFNGWMSEVRIWNIARTGNDILNNIHTILNPQPGLVGYYLMASRDTCQQIVYDRSTNDPAKQNNGVLGYSTAAGESNDPKWLMAAQINFNGVDPTGVSDTCKCSAVGPDTTCNGLHSLLEQYYFKYINPSSRLVTLDMRTFAGNKTNDEGPKGVFDVNGNLIGNTVNGTSTQIKKSYASIWNSSSVNKVVGILSLDSVSGKFILALNPGQTAPCNGIIGMRFYQYDIRTKDTAEGLQTAAGSYADFGDGKKLKLDFPYSDSNTTITGDNTTEGFAEDSTWLPQDYTLRTRVSASHIYPHTASLTKYTVTVYHTDLKGLISLDDEGAYSDTPHVSNLRGYCPQQLLEIMMQGTHDSTANRTDSIYNWSEINSLEQIEFRQSAGASARPYLKNNFGSFANNHNLKRLWLAPRYQVLPDTATMIAQAGKHFQDNFPNLPTNFPLLQEMFLAQYGFRYRDLTAFNYQLPKLKLLLLAFQPTDADQIDSILIQVARTSTTANGDIAYFSPIPTGSQQSPTSASTAAATSLHNNGWSLTFEFASPPDPTIGTGARFVNKDTLPVTNGFTDYLNQQLGTSMDFAAVKGLFRRQCGSLPDFCFPTPAYGPQLCGNTVSIFPEITLHQHSPCDDSTLFAKGVGTILYDDYQDSLIGDFNSRYMAKCLGARYNESFTVDQPVSEYHYTLYYYDQAGNLVKTVPPAGVDVSKFGWTSNWSDSVKTARLNKTVLTPNHQLPTNYRFNSINQVMAQNTPDAGLSEFWYDRLGRLALSRNAHQKAAGTSDDNNRLYSYTKYDVLGRITEVGQIKNTNTNGAMTDAISRSESSLNSWFTALNDNRGQVTRTVYDLPYSGFTGLDSRLIIQQRNLRNRVSYITISDTLTSTSTAYNQGTFFTYDAHGNVDTLLQDYGISTSVPNLMNKNGNEFKKTVYQYDLISGKVNKVVYQGGWIDQTFHRYTYDAENRQTLVETSLDGFVWEKDARYEYYKHGPMARMTIGDQLVQGVDYAYTLQGWLKGINSTGGTTSHDMGGDGATGTNQYTAGDAYGLTLNYFENEFAPIHQYTPAQTPFPGYKIGLSSFYRPLYNGNISSMSTYIGGFDNINHWEGAILFNNYKYDQLNRLTQMDVYNGFDTITANNKWPNPMTRLADSSSMERVAYDANGNILKYKRKGFSTTDASMDSLSYKYYAGTNKLSQIRDNVSASKWGSNSWETILDIDDQGTNNYGYDEIGNLIRDDAESITSIKWSVYGKILEIDRNATTNNNVTKVSYTYDAQGNRISKVVEHSGTSSKDYTWYVRDAQGNVMSTYGASGAVSGTGYDALSLTINERYLYGSSRLGYYPFGTSVDGGPGDMSFLSGATYNRGFKQYELTNHLGNVISTISDKKIEVKVGGVLAHYDPDIISANDYYPFGMLSRVSLSSTGNNYRYGFNGKENDWETKGWQNQLDYGERIYDPRAGRFLSLDPLQKRFPGWSPYSSFIDNPILFIDPKGQGGILTNYRVINNNGSLEIHADLVFNVYFVADPSVVTTEAVRQALSDHGYREGVTKMIGNGRLIGYNTGRLDTKDHGQTAVVLVDVKVNVHVVSSDEAKSCIENETNAANNYLFVNQSKIKGDALLNFGVNQGSFSLEALQSKEFTQILEHTLWHTADAKYYDNDLQGFGPHNNDKNADPNSVMSTKVLTPNDKLVQEDFDALNSEQELQRAKRHREFPIIGRITNIEGKFIDKIFGRGIINKVLTADEYLHYFEHYQEAPEATKKYVRPIIQ